MRAVVARVVRGAGRTALHLAVALALLILVAVGIGPLTGRYRVVTVLSGSMRPGLPVDSLAISTPEPLDRVRVGQIITFHAPIANHWMVTHRVIAVVSGGARPRVRTQGDANPAPDPWVARLNHPPLWQVRAVVPTAGAGVRAFRSRWLHRATVLGAPGVFVILSLAAIWWPAAPRRPPRHRRPQRHRRLVLGRT